MDRGIDEVRPFSTDFSHLLTLQITKVAKSHYKNCSINRSNKMHRKRERKPGESKGLLAYPVHRDFAFSPPREWIEQSEQHQHPKRSRGGTKNTFVVKLFRMLEQAEENGFQSIVSWRMHGGAFMIHDKARFTNEVLPAYFEQQNAFPSFQRQLNIWGFLRLTAQGPDRGAYYNDLFLRGRPEYLPLIPRQAIASNSVRRTYDPGTEPNFYEMPYVTATIGGLQAPANFALPVLLPWITAAANIGASRSISNPELRVHGIPGWGSTPPNAAYPSLAGRLSAFAPGLYESKSDPQILSSLHSTVDPMSFSPAQYATMTTLNAAAAAINIVSGDAIYSRHVATSSITSSSTAQRISRGSSPLDKDSVTMHSSSMDIDISSLTSGFAGAQDLAGPTMVGMHQAMHECAAFQIDTKAVPDINPRAAFVDDHTAFQPGERPQQESQDKQQKKSHDSNQVVSGWSGSDSGYLSSNASINTAIFLEDVDLDSSSDKHTEDNHARPGQEG